MDAVNEIAIRKDTAEITFLAGSEIIRSRSVRDERVLSKEIEDMNEVAELTFPTGLEIAGCRCLRG